VRRLPGRTPRWARRVLLVLLGVFLVLLALGAVAAVGIRSHLADGRDAVSAGKEKLIGGDAGEAASDFDRAASAFGEAADGARAIPLRVLGWMPFIGRTPDAIVAIAQAGARTAEAGEQVARGIDDLPGGVRSLAPVHGAVPIAPLRTLAKPLARADALASEAYGLIAAAPDTLLVGPVGEARRQAQDQLAPLSATLHSAAAIVGGLPAFLGSDHPTRFYFAAAGPAEQRGTGGLIGAYSVMTIDDGRVSFTPFKAVQGLPLPKVSDVPSPSAEFSRNYDTFRDANGFWLNINMTPDFPLAARAMQLALEHETHIKVDGVIQADPFALQALLELTGSAPVPGLGITVDANNVVPFTTNEAYVEYAHDSETRKLVLGEVAQSVVERFLDEADPSVGGLRKLVATMAEGHIQVYSRDEEMERGLAGTGVGGSLPRTAGDFLSVVQNNGGGQKIDYYADRHVDYRVDLGPDGSASAKLDVSLKNEAPDSGLPPYIIGPIPGVSDVGENAAIFSAYCRADCELRAAELNGEPDGLRSGTEAGYRYYQGEIRVGSGATGTFRTQLASPTAWQGNSSGGSYRLTFLNQTTIRPTRLHVEITPPTGMQVRSMSEGLEQRGGQIVYDGTPGRTLELAVTFSPPLAQRLWRNVTRFFTQPVVRL
jgi:Protein of unknown function (DUF4012)